MTVFPSILKTRSAAGLAEAVSPSWQPAAPEPAASKSAASVVLSAAKAPVLSWKDDYATRHLDLGEPP